MTKTNRIAAAIALIASTVATGCAVDDIDCSAEDCSAIETANEAGPNEDIVSERGEDNRVTAREVRDPQLRQFPKTLPPLQDWVLRMDAGIADACDLRFAGYVAGEHEELSLQSCENSVIAEIVAEDTDGPIVVPFNGFNAEETKWMLLGLDISEDNPLSATQVQMIAEAHDASIQPKSPITAEAIDELNPAFEAHDLAPLNN